MGRIFLHVFAMLAVAFLAGCNRNELKAVELPADVTAVTAPFFKAVRSGDRAAAEKWVNRYFVDDTQAQFAAAHDDLDHAPRLIPIAYRPKPTAFGVDENEATIFYVGKKGREWVTAEIRLGRIEGESFDIEYWNVLKSPDMPPILKVGQDVRFYTIIASVAVALAALLFLALLIWFVKRKAHLLGPQPLSERREGAKTTRDM